MIQLEEMIRCPVTQTSLVAASGKMLDDLNRKIESQTLVNHAGYRLKSRIEAGWVNEDQSFLHPVRNGILVLAQNQAIPIGEFE